MGAGHSHGDADTRISRMLIAAGILSVFFVIELTTALLINSIALLADAGHMLSDVGALALSLFALWMAQKPATPRHTYGYYRTEILAALANAATLIAISLFIFIEAFQRFRHPEPVMGLTVMWIAAGGLAVNLIGLLVLHGGKDDSLNIRGAWLHMLTDALGSVGAILGGAAVWVMGWRWADPAVSIAIAVLVLYSSWHLLRESVGVLLEGTPAHIDPEAVRAAMQRVQGVEGVHDLHVWTITSGLDALSAHVVVGDRALRRESGEILAELHALLHDEFHLHHLTIQIEPRDFEEQRCVPLAGS